MPIKIRDNQNDEIAWLCSDDWELPIQLQALEEWIRDQKTKAGCSADIGYAPRPGALGGGGKLSSESIKKMAELDMELYFSEYPPLGETNDVE